jgi:hypothetical protein
MRIRNFYQIVILLVAFSAWAGPQVRMDHHAGAEEEEYKTVDELAEAQLEEDLKADEGHQARQYFDQQMADLKDRLSSVSDPSTRMEMVKQTVKDIRNFRKDLKMGFVADEIHMDIVLQSFEALPGPETFEKKRCPAYQDKVILNYEPSAPEGKPVSPAVQQTLDLLKSVCG